MFEMTLRQMLTMFAFMLVGYVLRKGRILPETSGVTMARLETYLFVPALTVYSMATQCTVATFRDNARLILYGGVIIACVILLAIPLSHLFVPNAKTDAERYQRSIYRYGMSFANAGFMGNFIILGVFGEEMFFKYQMIGLTVTVLCYSYGVYLLIPKEQNAGLWHNIKKGLTVPPMLAAFVGIAIGLLDLGRFLPPFLVTMMNNAGSCQGPVAMVLAGFVIAGFPLKELFVNVKMYVVSLVRLIVIPGAILLVLHLLHTPKELMALVLIYFGTPLGLNSIVYPEAYGGDVKAGASMASISHVMSVATIPLMYLLFIELL